MSCRSPAVQCASRQPAQVVRAAGGKQRGGGGSKQRRSGGGGGGKGRPTQDKPAAKSKPLQMAEFKSDEILMFQPVAAARDALQVVYAYPSEYTVGITSLGYQLVWAFFETRADVAVTRLFTDAHDPLPAATDLLGFSFAWELDYSNILSMLEQLGIPLLAAERGDEHPLVFGGGPVLTANPEPFANFFDMVLLGDGEDLLSAFTERLQEAKQQLSAAHGGGAPPRRELLLALAQVPGVYVPQLYNVQYQSLTGPVQSITPAETGVPLAVQKQTYRGVMLANSTVVSKRMAWENIYMAEVVRSCPEMCRFCLASYLTLPFRPASLEGSLIPSLERGLAVTDRLGLLGASVTQHPEFSELLDWLMQPERAHVRLSIASVRTNTVTPQLAAALSSRGTRSLTVAVESGSQRVRDIVNKKLATEEIVQCAQHAQEGGLEGLKLYGMVGVPGEGEEDIDATIELMQRLRRAAPKLRLTLGCSTFVPKAHTPFQWYGVSSEGEKRLKRLEKALGKEGIEFRPESYKWSVVQALLSRGDRRLSRLLLLVRQYGDSLGSFRRAFKELQGDLPPMEHYVSANYDPDTAVLPWGHLHGPLPAATLRKHLAEAQTHMSAAAASHAEEGAVPV
ncbi:radical SAM [Micractinium conductrix]|uniref:Radical SAM n=1 Tax=Micractinium conductrix TaxID=554055 RepID=A0A2P6VIR9_9CHLO|nr:radical SAM [Micractinium conductrix]|eukprot:PSC73970.1 radical SAM [Micractinium conductrix]